MDTRIEQNTMTKGPRLPFEVIALVFDLATNGRE